MTEDPEDKGIDERHWIQRIKKLTVGRQSADFPEIPEMSGICFHILPHRPDFRNLLAALEIS